MKRLLIPLACCLLLLTACETADVPTESTTAPTAIPIEQAATEVPVAATPSEVEPTEATLTEVLAEAGTFNTLLDAFERVEFIEKLTTEGPYELFAPTDAAFNQLPTETLDGLLSDPEQLLDVLLYHVVEGGFGGSESVTSLLGDELIVEADEAGVASINGVPVVDELPAVNGTVHVIESVLVPPSSGE